MRTTYLILVIIMLVSCTEKQNLKKVDIAQNPVEDWENPELFSRNKEQPRASFIPFESKEQVIENKAENSPFYTSLHNYLLLL